MIRLCVLSLRYSSWSIRPWLALKASSVPFELETIEIEDLGVQKADQGLAPGAISATELGRRRAQGSVTGLFPVLYVDNTPVHESLAICEWVADSFPEAALWPEDRLERARARAACVEMVSGFHNLRAKMSCHVFARVPDHQPDAATENDIRRVFEIWRGALDSSGGPFLFGSFGIADCMYFPVLSRFRTYGVPLDSDLEAYAANLHGHPAVEAWGREAEAAPPIPAYDEHIRKLGGDPEAARPG